MSEPNQTESEHLDLATLTELEALLEDDFVDLIETFLADARVRCDDMAQTVTSKVPDDIRQAAHSFKGSSLNIGAIRLSDLCKRMEDHARQGRTLYAEELQISIEKELKIVDRLLREKYL